MARVVLCVLALLVAGGLSDPVKKSGPPTPAELEFLQHQNDLMFLFFHIKEPNHFESSINIAKTWSLEKNIEHFSNVTAVTTYIEMLEHQWLLPRAVPFSILETEHRFEAVTLYNVLVSAKDYDTFYKTAVYVRDRVNEHLFAYVLSIAILNRPDTRGIYVPRMHEIFPSYYNNGQVMATAQRINTHGFRMIEHYPSTYKWDENIVIRLNETIWPYYNSHSTPVAYFTHDHILNTFYYNSHLSQPNWLHSEALPVHKHRRGEWFWFLHKQIVARYYMERLSNGLGEIPELGHDIVEEGYNSGLLYHNGVAFPVRPNYFNLNQPAFVKELDEIYNYESRIREAIDLGYVINHVGEHIKIDTPEGIEILGRIIESSIDSPNGHYYKDFISIWKKVLGNSLVGEHHYFHNSIPLVVPSVLEHYQTALRDPAFYMIWKRVLGLFQLWQEKLPHYKREELALPQVAIQKVDVDKLVTYFEYNYLNVTSALHLNEEEAKGTVYDQVSVLVQRPKLNHKKFQTRIHVKSEVAKKVIIKLFLGPKFDSHGYEIPLQKNTQNFMQMDEFIYDLPQGECVIARDSIDSNGKDFVDAYQVYQLVEKAMQGKAQFHATPTEGVERMGQHLLLPKGRVGGMPFVLMVYISEYQEPQVPHDTTVDPSVVLGLPIMVTKFTDKSYGFPVNRPLYPWQVDSIKNLHLQDVLIYHKHTPEIEVPHTE